MTKVSVIVPVYNVSSYLERCLNSLINQTLKDIEIVIINDGSTDNSPEICEKYAKKYKNIKYISQTNKGLSAARNIGIENANGNFIGFVDSDDFVEKDMFEFLYNNAIKHKVKISCCGHVSYFEDGTIKLNSKPNIRKKYTKNEALDMYLIQEYFDIISCNKIYSKELFETIKFPVGKLYEDMQVLYKWIDIADGLYLDTTPKYYYFKRANSISNNSFNNNTLEIIKNIDNYKKFCDDKLTHKKYIYIGEIRWLLVVVNKMILANQIDDRLVKRIKKCISKRLGQIIFTNKLSFIRKLQMLLFWISVTLYKKIYIKDCH